jgi:hypothetical protein
MQEVGYPAYVDELAETPLVWSDELVRYRCKSLYQVIEAVGGLGLRRLGRKGEEKEGKSSHFGCKFEFESKLSDDETVYPLLFNHRYT